MSLPRFSTRRPVAIAMFFLAIALLGVISYVRLPIDLLPDISYPQLVVYTSYPDVAPAEVERLVTDKVEAESAGVPGIQQVTSVSRDGVSLVTLRFVWGTDMDFAMLNVREKMDNLRELLPETATRPRILRVDPQSDAIVVLSVSGGSDLQETKELAETVFRRRFEQLDGVAQAAVTGGLDREIQVEVKPELLQAYGLVPNDVSNALARANVSAPGGMIREGNFRYPLRTLGEFLSVDELNDVVVARQASPGAGSREGSVRLIRLRDVGSVVDGFAERESIARLDGQEAVGILLFKEGGANTVSVARAVGDVIEQLKAEYPAVSIDVASSQAGFVSAAINNLTQEVIVGALLAFLVLFLFLRDPRYPVVIAMSIPASVLATFGLFEATGVTLNIMSLGGLALGVGMLTDNSIVVLENIFRHREMGKDAAEAAAAGTEEVSSAIIGSTITTVGVFAPIIYVEGVAGQLFRDLSLAITYSLLTSLVVALTLLPAWAARIDPSRQPARRPERAPGAPMDPSPTPRGWVGRAGAVGRKAAGGGMAVARGAGHLVGDLFSYWGGGIGGFLGRTTRPLLDAFDRGYERFAHRYHDALEWCLDRPWQTVGWSVLALGVAIVAGLSLPRDLLPDVDQGAFDVRIQLPEGSDLQATADAAATVEAALKKDPGVDAVFSRIGRDVRAYQEGEERSYVNTALLQVRVARGEKTARVMERMRPAGAEIPTATVTMDAGQATTLGRILGGDAADVAVRIRSEDLDAAQARADEVALRLGKIERLANVRVGTEKGTPELQVEIRRDQAAAYGIDPSEVADAVDRAMRGDLATQYVDFDRKVAVMVRYPETLRTSRSTLETLRVRGVPLRELVTVEEVVGPAEVRHVDQGRVVTVYADVQSGGVQAAMGDVQGALRDLPPVRDLRIEVGGENEEMRRSFRDLLFAFLLASVLVYMVLAAEFESFAHPFTILMAIPLSVIGAVLGLIVMGAGINTISLIGLIILVGIVDNDAVVKVDFINQARAAGMGVREAIVEGGRVRLRPIVMTGAATIVGLMPIAFGIGSGAALQAPMAIVVIAGLAVATLLTLVVIPVIYMLIEEARESSRVRGAGVDLAPAALPHGAD